MKCKDLAKKLMEYPEFDVEFAFYETDNSEYGMTCRAFNDVQVEDIGHSDKVVLLGGDEY